MQIAQTYIINKYRGEMNKVIGINDCSGAKLRGNLKFFGVVAVIIILIIVVWGYLK